MIRERVFRLTSSEEQEWVMPAIEADIDLLVTSGRSVAAGWKTVQVEALRKGDFGETLHKVDLPWFDASMPILRQRARAVLEPVIGDFGEFLPLDDGHEILWAFNATTVLTQAIDEDMSELRYLSSGSLYEPIRLAFRPEAVTGPPIFKLAEWLRGPVLVNSRFVSAAHAGRLSGLNANLVWEAPGRT